MTGIDVTVAKRAEFPSAQRFYESCGYAGTAIVPSDFVVLAKNRDRIVGIGRLCFEQELLWLRGMQVGKQLQRRGIGSRILRLLDQEIGSRWCCCLPYGHLANFYRQAGFERAIEGLPTVLGERLDGYLSRGLEVVAMIRGARSRPDHSSEPEPIRAMPQPRL